MYLNKATKGRGDFPSPHRKRLLITQFKGCFFNRHIVVSKVVIKTQLSSSSNLHVIVEAIGLSLKGTRKRKRMNNVHQRMEKVMLRQALYMEDLTGQRNMIKRKAPEF